MVTNGKISTRVSAARVLGSFIRAILTVKLSVTLPFLLVEAAAIGAAELIWTTCWVFYTRTQVCSLFVIHIQPQFVLKPK